MEKYCAKINSVEILRCKSRFDNGIKEKFLLFVQNLKMTHEASLTHAANKNP